MRSRREKSSMRSIATAIALIVFAIACHSGRPSRPQPGSGDLYLILASELESTRQANLYDAVRQLRPFWFTRTVRGRTGENTVAVYVDEQLIGTLSALRRLPVFATERVRYMTPTEAQVQFGARNGQRAAILVDSAKP